MYFQTDEIRLFDEGLGGVVAVNLIGSSTPTLWAILTKKGSEDDSCNAQPQSSFPFL